MKKIPIAILGATGTVGQRMVALLADHPWFSLVQVAASERSVGKPYAQATTWLLDTPMPEQVRSMIVSSCVPARDDIQIALSALDAETALQVEPEWANRGIRVVSNASAYRMHESVPLVIPEVNSDHLALARSSSSFQNGGMIVTNPNCVVIGLSLALKPLVDLFGLSDVMVTSFQSISGAGFPGVASLSILDNLIPYIGNEEPKVESEPKKIFGSLDGGKVNFHPMNVSATCVRVPVTEGHLKSVSVKLQKRVTFDEIVDAWNTFVPSIPQLPTSPSKVLLYDGAADFPQPKLHRSLGRGMTVSIGRLRPCPLLGWKFVVLSHNTIRGAAGGSLLIAELLARTCLH